MALYHLSLSLSSTPFCVSREPSDLFLYPCPRCGLFAGGLCPPYAQTDTSLSLFWNPSVCPSSASIQPSPSSLFLLFHSSLHPSQYHSVYSPYLVSISHSISLSISILNHPLYLTVPLYSTPCEYITHCITLHHSLYHSTSLTVSLSLSLTVSHYNTHSITL